MNEITLRLLVAKCVCFTCDEIPHEVIDGRGNHSETIYEISTSVDGRKMRYAMPKAVYDDPEARQSKLNEIAETLLSFTMHKWNIFRE